MMKNILALILLVCFVSAKAQSQWNGNAAGIYTTKKVSIGAATSSADYSLQIWQQSDDRFGGMRIRNSANGQSSYFWMDSNNRLRLDNSSTAYRDIVFSGQGTGNVGFGIINPNYRVDIQGTIGLRENTDTYTNGDVRIFNHPGDIWGFMIRPHDNGSWTYDRDFGYQENNGTWYVENGFNVRTGMLDVSQSMVVGSSLGSSTITDNNTFSTHAGLIVGNAGFVLDADNDGINIISRTRMKFYVDESSGNANQAMAISRTGKVGIGIGPNDNYDLRVNSSFRVGRMIQKTVDDSNEQFDIGYNDKLHFTHGNDYSRKIMTLVGSGGSGRVGIGTTSPDHKLDVNGTIHSEEVIVDLNVPGPDYVFEEDYQLQDLSSLEQYLRENKHLPEVPSADEMEEDGINVGEMEMLLLKKVEELTLHLIEQNKTNQHLLRRVQNLEEELKASGND